MAREADIKDAIRRSDEYRAESCGRVVIFYSILASFSVLAFIATIQHCLVHHRWALPELIVLLLTTFIVIMYPVAIKHETAYNRSRTGTIHYLFEP